MMTDNTPGGTHGPPPQEAAGTPVPVVHGHADPEELSAVVAIVAVLAAAEGADDAEDAARADSQSAQSQIPARSPWSGPDRMVRRTYPHGPGGWRGAASPR